MNTIFFSHAPKRSDLLIASELEHHDSWSDDINQIARFAAKGHPVARINRHTRTNELVRTDLTDILPHLVKHDTPMHWAGSPELNVPKILEGDFFTKLTVLIQGSVTVNHGYLINRHHDVAVIGVDLSEKYATIEGTGCGDECTIMLSKGGEFTVLKFDGYDDWHVRVASISRYTLNVCLIPNQSHPENYDDQ